MTKPETATASGQAPARGRDVLAAALLVAGLLLPWNIHTGVGIAGTSGWVFAVLVAVTVAALAATGIGELARRGDSKAPIGLRLPLCGPYLLVVAIFTLTTIVSALRHGGDGVAAPGIGPGALLGLAGALLAAQPPLLPGGGQRTARVRALLGWASILLGVLAALFNLYLRIRFVVAGFAGPAAGANIMTAVTALLYTVVALAPIVLVGRWIIAGTRAHRLATTLLGIATLVATALLWLLPVGRDLDAFHGIAQNTGTAGVGYEGYLAWVAVAGLVGAAALRAASAADAEALWRAATRSCLILVAVWCGGTAVLRIVGVVLNGMLQLPALPYNNTALMAFDVLTAVVAAWLALNSGHRATPRAVTLLLLGVVFVLTGCRLVVGVALVPRSMPLNPGTINAVYGNDLSQQITGIIDATLAVLALLLLVAAFLRQVRTPASRPQPARPAPARPAPAAAPQPAPAPAVAAPRIAAAPPKAPRIAAPPPRDQS